METIPSQSDSEHVSPVPPVPPGGRRRRWAFRAAIIAGVLAVAVVAVVLVDGRSKGKSQVASSISSPSPAPVAPTPMKLKATAEPFKVALTWREGSDGTVNVSRYTISRDGHVLHSTSDGGLRYVDTTALPSQRYRYTVQAVGTDGTLGEVARVSVRTPKAPLSVARLKGVFNMKFHITSSYGVNGFDDKTEGWRFSPGCARGACSTRLRDIHWQRFSTDLHRSGGSYVGALTMTDYVVCGGTPDTSSISINLHITKAKALSNAWRATAVRGTMTVSGPAQLGCTSHRIEYSVTGTMPGAGV
jgi:hypothetical protein